MTGRQHLPSAYRKLFASSTCSKAFPLSITLLQAFLPDPTGALPVRRQTNLPEPAGKAAIPDQWTEDRITEDAEGLTGGKLHENHALGGIGL